MKLLLNLTLLASCALSSGIVSAADEYIKYGAICEVTCITKNPSYSCKYGQVFRTEVTTSSYDIGSQQNARGEEIVPARAKQQLAQTCYEANCLLDQRVGNCHLAAEPYVKAE